jgi:hypothetical protein
MSLSLIFGENGYFYCKKLLNITYKYLLRGRLKLFDQWCTYFLCIFCLFQRKMFFGVWFKQKMSDAEKRPTTYDNFQFEEEKLK